MLGVGDHSLVLNPRDRRLDQHEAQVRIFSRAVLEAASSVGEASQVQPRPELNVSSFASKLFALQQAIGNPLRVCVR